MRRNDLLALGPEALAALANLGLVKRAQREIAAGQGPTIAVEDDGTVVGTFADGVCARLPPGSRLEACPCTCKSTGVCRHRIAVVLAYREGAAAEPAPAPVVDAAVAAPDDAALRTHLGARIFATAETIVARGLVVTVEGDAVHLPTCSVRFLVGDAPEYARCDCAATGPCEHIAIATWARRVPSGGTFELGADAQRVTAKVDATGLRELEALGAAILEGGVTQSLDSLAERFASLRARHADATWVTLVLDDLQRQLEAYASRSARYDEAQLVQLLAELAARARAARHPSAALPVRYVLGVGEAQQTALEQLRLVSLGARLHADADVRWAHVYLADPDSGAVLVLETQWQHDAAADKDGIDSIRRRSVASGVALGALAHGQVVTRAAKRRANLSLVLGTRKGTTALLPGACDLSALPPALYVRDYAVAVERLSRRPPRLLRPRVLADGLMALAIARVSQVVYVPATQTLHAFVHDAADVPAHVVLTHRAIAPHAIDALAAALTTGATTIIGRAQVTAGGLQLEPTAVDGPAGFVVVDLAGPTEAPGLERVVPPRAVDPVGDAITSAGALLAQLTHHGLRRAPPDLASRLRRTATACEETGLVGFAARLRALADTPSARTWIDAAIVHGLLSQAAC